MSNPTLLPLLYANDGTYGWSKGMRAISHTLLADQQHQPGTILELGCGAGIFLQEMATRRPRDLLVGTDIHPLALAHAGQGTPTPNAPNPVTVQFAQSDLHQLPFRDQEFSLLLAFDVYDQQGVELAAALHESHRVLQPQGHLLLRVSAHPWLMSAHDAAFNTARRFSRRALLAAVHRTPFTPLRVTYANTLLAPLVIALRLLQRWSLLPHSRAQYTDALSNRLLAALLYEEARWLRHHNLPGGISLYVLARKDA